MSHPASLPSRSLYAAVEALPEGVVGEVVDGQLYVHPRPSARHGVAATRVGADLSGPFDRGRGGPGGWWIVVEPEVHFVRDVELCVPDVAGWRRRRLPELPDGHRFEAVPDWLLEVSSPSTASYDRETKMPCYAAFGVPHVWIADPGSRVLEVHELADGRYREIGRFEGDSPIRAVPFEAIEIEAPWA